MNFFLRSVNRFPIDLTLPGEHRIKRRACTAHGEDPLHSRSRGQCLDIICQIPVRLVGAPDADHLWIPEIQNGFKVCPHQCGIDHHGNRSDSLDCEEQRKDLCFRFSKEGHMITVPDPAMKQLCRIPVCQIVQLPIGQAYVAVDYSRTVGITGDGSAQERADGGFFQRKHRGPPNNQNRWYFITFSPSWQWVCHHSHTKYKSRFMM